jgi:hypothetical protein
VGEDGGERAVGRREWEDNARNGSAKERRERTVGERTVGEDSWRGQLERTVGEDSWRGWRERGRWERTVGEDSWRGRLERTVEEDGGREDDATSCEER